MSFNGYKADSQTLIAGLSNQSNKLETELSSLIRLIASAIKGAMVNCLMLWDTRTASVAMMLSVMTRSSMGDDVTRATAPPDNTPWVT